MEKKSTNRSFGIIFSIVFLIVTFWPIINGNNPNYWFLIPSFIFLILGLLNSKILSPLNTAWIKFGNILGKVIAPIVMGLIFFPCSNTYWFIYENFRKRFSQFKIK